MITIPQEAIDALPFAFRGKAAEICEQQLATEIWDGITAHVVPVQQYGKYIGCIDTTFGHDLVWDGQEWHMARYGVFLEDVIFVSDNYGYPEGAFFSRVIINQEVFVVANVEWPMRVFAKLDDAKRYVENQIATHEGWTDPVSEWAGWSWRVGADGSYAFGDDKGWVEATIMFLELFGDY